jgi:hypothetical protein
MDALLRSSVELAAAKSPGQKLAEALELMEWGVSVQRARLRAQHADASEPALDAMLIAWLGRDD